MHDQPSCSYLCLIGRAILLAAASIPRSLAHLQHRPLMHPRMSAPDSSGLYTLGDSFLAFYTRKGQSAGADRAAAAATHAAAVTTAVPPTSAPLQSTHQHSGVTMDGQQAPVSGEGAVAQLSSTAQVSASQTQQPLADGGATQLASVMLPSSNGAVPPLPSQLSSTGKLAAPTHTNELDRSAPAAAPPLSEAGGAAAHSTAATASGNGSNGAQLPSAQFALSQVSCMLVAEPYRGAHR
jgi:hypothetical protein